jgi:hypothetical protein
MKFFVTSQCKCSQDGNKKGYFFLDPSDAELYKDKVQVSSKAFLHKFFPI